MIEEEREREARARTPGPHEPVYTNCDELPDGHDWQDHAEAVAEAATEQGDD